MFTPFNFHDSDPTRRSVQGVRIDNGDEKTKVRYYGGRYREGVSLKAVSGSLHFRRVYLLFLDSSRYAKANRLFPRPTSQTSQNITHPTKKAHIQKKETADFMALAFGFFWEARPLLQTTK